MEKQIRHLRTRLRGLMLKDRNTLSVQLTRLSQLARQGDRSKKIFERLDSIENRVDGAAHRKTERLARKPRLSYPADLPILKKKDDIVRGIQDHQVLIISGDTGSGKSTQIPKMCLEAGRGKLGKIGCTQPRRIAAITVAQRIAEELGQPIGNAVGYKIRFTDRTAPLGFIKIMTDGMLLAETQQDPSLLEYDTLIIDEAHERSLNIDFLLGILKTLMVRRKDLKIVITSATIDTEKFSKAFDHAPVIQVKGRRFPVLVKHMPLDPVLERSGDTTYVDMAVRAVEAMRADRSGGDILIFMPTEQDIRETCDLLEGRCLPGVKMLPLFARLTAAQQKRVFAPCKGQKIVVATNVAETSLTIPGIKYVIDTGLARIPRYVPRTRTTSLPISPISRSSADQRKGRCGRVRDGVCIRLYSETDYESRPEFTDPEILRSNLADVILRMLSLRMGHIVDFPFVDRPNPRSVKDGEDLLVELGAVERGSNGLVLTRKGNAMARLPLDPQISRMLLEAHAEGCIPEVAVIASALSIQDPRERPLEKAKEADALHAPFKDPNSDFLTLLNIWNRYRREWDTLKTQNKMRKFCYSHFLSFVRMREWRDIHDQVLTLLKQQGMAARRETSVAWGGPDTEIYARIHRAVLSGYLSNIATRKEKNIYLAAKGRSVMVFPGSALFNKGCPWIVAAEMVKTTQLFARTAARIDPAWLEPLGKGLCRSSVYDPHWEKNRGEVRALERVTLFGLPIVTGRPISYGRIERDDAHRIFVQAALVDGNVKGPLPFLVHNQKLIATIEGIEDKIRRRGVLLSDQDMAAFYSERLPGVTGISELKKRIRDKGGDRFLRMAESDLLASRPDMRVLDGFPDHVTLGDHRFPFSYKFAPGEEADGVTISVPSTLAARFPDKRLDWMVPGLLKEKITALIKGLPKSYRKQLVPVSRTADIICSDMEETDEPLVTALARFIYHRFGVDIPASQWPAGDISNHLRMRVSVTDHAGKELGSGRDFHRLKQAVAEKNGGAAEQREWAHAKSDWERNGITTWDFEALPEQVSLGPRLAAYPALAPEDRSVRIRLFADADEARAVHRKGVAALFALHLGKELKFLKRFLKLPQDLALTTTP
ncbi:MAG: ATP-dependent RNA helicase HrpA, partial [Deltaproteobacteria bacterium]|nr:ATP-dependent RNA helicase HrpA [Deltaproteobacteria bacterium]